MKPVAECMERLIVAVMPDVKLAAVAASVFVFLGALIFLVILVESWSEPLWQSRSQTTLERRRLRLTTGLPAFVPQLESDWQPVSAAVQLTFATTSQQSSPLFSSVVPERLLA
jgi:hypothetical protein